MHALLQSTKIAYLIVFTTSLHSSLVKEQQMEIETFANHLSSFENKVKALKESSVENGIDQFQV